MNFSGKKVEIHVTEGNDSGKGLGYFSNLQERLWHAKILLSPLRLRKIPGNSPLLP
jgi:hypothetical protein